MKTLIVEHLGGKDTYIPEHEKQKYIADVDEGHLYVKHRIGVEQFPKTIIIYAPGVWHTAEYKDVYRRKI